MAPKAVLVGLPGSGKSTIGRRLAKALGVDLLDTDAAIEETTARTIADIFATDGEQEFRRIEEEAVRAALAVRAAGAVAVKSVAAYRTGLDLNPQRPPEAEVTAAAGRWRARAPAGRRRSRT